MAEVEALSKKGEIPASKKDHSDAADAARHNSLADVFSGKGAKASDTGKAPQVPGQFSEARKEPATLDLATDQVYETKSRADAEQQVGAGVRTTDSINRTQADNAYALLIKPKDQGELFGQTSESDAFKQGEARQNLVNSIEQTGLKAQQKANCFVYMEQFERRARREGLTESQITDTYKALSKMMEAKNASDGGKIATHAGERTLALTGFLYSSVYTDNIDQGNHNTCNVSQLRDKEVEENPAQAAARLCALTCDGQFLSKGRNGEPDRMITLNSDDIKPDIEALLQANGPMDNMRNYFGQLSDLALINDYWQRRGLTYTQRQPNFGFNDTGERLEMTGTSLDIKGTRLKKTLGSLATTGATRTMIGKDGNPICSPSLNGGAINEIGERMGFKDFIYANDDWDPDAKVGKLNTQEALAERLKQGKIVMIVNASHPIYTGTADQGGAGRSHVVQVSAVEGRPDLVRIDNTWGAGNDRVVSLDAFFDSTREHWQLAGYRNAETQQAWSNWQAAGGNRLAPNQVLRQNEFERTYRSFKDQMATPEKLTDKDPIIEDGHNKELLAQRDDHEKDKQEEESHRQAQRAQIERLVQIDNLQSQLANARNNSELPQTLIQELNQTLANLLSSHLA